VVVMVLVGKGLPWSAIVSGISMSFAKPAILCKWYMVPLAVWYMLYRLGKLIRYKCWRVNRIFISLPRGCHENYKKLEVRVRVLGNKLKVMEMDQNSACAWLLF